jgi:glycosyltransferase involved in cell wall biosynthesis
MKKRIYFISSAFAPLGRTSVIMSHYARFLAEDGFDVRVITTGERKGFFLNWVNDYELYEQIKQVVDIRIIKYPQYALLDEIIGILKIQPTMLMRWVKEVERNANSFIDKDGIILAVYPDIADLYIGEYLKKKYNLPLIIDLRDLPQSFTSNVKNEKWFNLEKNFFKNADFITVATDTIKNNLIERYNYPENRIETVYNGFGDINTLENKTVEVKKKDFVITYAGTMSVNQKPEILTLAYKKLVEKYPDAAKNIKIHIYSQKGYYYHLKFKNTIISGVEYKGYLPHSELMNTIKKECDLCFLPLASESLSYALPAKLFEYINLEKPILGALPNGDARKLIEKHDIGRVCHYNDIDGIANMIYEIYNNKERFNQMEINVVKAKPEFYLKNQISKIKEVIANHFSPIL